MTADPDLIAVSGDDVGTATRTTVGEQGLRAATPSFRTFAAVVTAWTVVAVVFGAQQAVIEGMLTRDIVLGVLLYDGLWALATLGIISLVRTKPSMASYALGRWLPVHLGLAALTTLTVLSAYSALGAIVDLSDDRSIGQTIQSNLLSGLVTYGLMLTVILVLVQRETARKQGEAAFATEQALAQARAALLQSQLQPHFLFNALNAIASLIHEDSTTAELMVARLGDFLRLSLDSQGGLVPLSRELEAVDAYLAIQTLRFGDRLTVVRKISPEALGVQVPYLILQPLAENALHHGLGPLRDGGTLELTAACVSGRLELVVADDGAGPGDAAASEGLGLTITRDRVRLLGGTVDTVCSTQEGGRHGFTVRLSLPWRTV